jgi:hypothetical protein
VNITPLHKRKVCRQTDKYHVNESTLVDLYRSTEKAYPRTTLRQHAWMPIKIQELSIVPFKGLKTIFFKSTARNEERHYNTVILCKNVIYHEQTIRPKTIKIKDEDGHTYFFEPVSIVENDVLVRCNCKDFSYRFAHFNYLDKSLFGRDRKKYESKGILPPVNPKELPGMCKHLFAMSVALRDSGLIK